MNDYLAASNATSLLDMANGAIKERIDYEMGRVMQNISDPNTKASAKREITLKNHPGPGRRPQAHRGQLHRQQQAGSHEPGEDQPGDRPRERPDRSRGTYPADPRPA